MKKFVPLLILLVVSGCATNAYNSRTAASGSNSNSVELEDCNFSSDNLHEIYYATAICHDDYDNQKDRTYCYKESARQILSRKDYLCFLLATKFYKI